MKYDFDKLMRDTMDPGKEPSDKLNQRVMRRVESEKTKRRAAFPKFYRAAAAALAGVILTGGVVYAAAQLWNRDVAEKYGVAKDERMMTELRDKGFAAVPTQTADQGGAISATDQDITVKVLQTLADEKTAYVYFEVDYGDKYRAADEGCTERSDTGVTMPMVQFTTASGKELSYCGGISEVKNANRIAYEYEILAEKGSLEGETIQMNIRQFTKDMEKADAHPLMIAKGKWKLSWDLSVGTEKRIYDLNQKITLGNADFTLKQLTITPLSYELLIEETDGVSLSSVLAVVRDRGEKPAQTDADGNVKVIRYVNTDGRPEREDEISDELPKGQSIYFLDSVSAFFLGDTQFDGDGGMGSASSKKGIYSLIGIFDKVMDLEELTAFRVAGKYISLEGRHFETMNAF